MKMTKSNDSDTLLAACPVCTVVAGMKTTVCYKIKDFEGDWDGKLLRCGSCGFILEIKQKDGKTEA